MKTVDSASMDPYLGKVQDKFIAEKYGLSVAKVCLIRHKLGVPASHIHPPQISSRKFDWDKIVCRLGIIPDVKLAKEAGVSRERIRQLRIKYGIPKYNKSSVVLGD